MNILLLISWSVVAFIIYNLYNTTKSYYAYYIEMRNEVRSGDADEQTIYNFGFMHFLPMILLQLLKLALIIAIPLLVTSYSHKKELSVWSPEELDIIYESCMSEDNPNEVLTIQEREDYCNCYVDKISRDKEIRVHLIEKKEVPQSLILKVANECLDELGLIVKNNVNEKKKLRIKDFLKILGLIIMFLSGYSIGGRLSHISPEYFSNIFKLYWFFNRLFAAVAFMGLPIYFAFEYSWWYVIWGILLGIAGGIVAILFLLKHLKIDEYKIFIFWVNLHFALILLFLILLIANNT